MSALVVNLFGGAGVGKSTTAAQVFAALKELGIETELASELAKDLVWAKHVNTLVDHPVYVLGEQIRRVEVLAYHEDLQVVVTDSPFMLATVYAEDEPRAYADLARWHHERLNTLNVRLLRVKRYSPIGRLQDEAGAVSYDLKVAELGIRWDMEVPGSPEGARAIVNEVLRRV
jgi:hypothetical protein